MPRPRGVNTRLFSNRTRAVVLEAEWKVMPERIAPELKPLVKLAKDQGWTISGSNNGKLVWRGPNGEGPVYTGYRCQGRDLQNYRAELVRNGLRLDEENAKAHSTYTEVAEMLEAHDTNPMSVEEIAMHIDIVMKQLSPLIAKATLCDEARKQTEEWKQMAEEALSDSEKVVAKLSEARTMIDAIRECFNMAPWAILPEIARLLGIDAGGPTLNHLTPTAIKEAKSG